MDSKTVNAEIKRVAWPMLRAAGFDRFVARNGWRTTDEAIAVVNFQSFNASKASTLHCTPYSFAINLGVYYRCFGLPDGPVMVKGAGMPHEYSCQVRLHLDKTIYQPDCVHEKIWYVADDPKLLPTVVQNAARMIESVGLPWVERFLDPAYALDQHLLPRSESNPEYVFPLGTYGAAEYGEVLARHLGRISDAYSLWEAVLKNDYYRRMEDVCQTAHQRLTDLRTLAQRQRG